MNKSSYLFPHTGPAFVLLIVAEVSCNFNFNLHFFQIVKDAEHFISNIFGHMYFFLSAHLFMEKYGIWVHLIVCVFAHVFMHTQVNQGSRKGKIWEGILKALGKMMKYV